MYVLHHITATAVHSFTCPNQDLAFVNCYTRNFPRKRNSWEQFSLSNVTFSEDFSVFSLAFQLYVNPSVWFFLTLQAHFAFLCCHIKLLANTNRGKLPILCLVSLFLFKFLAKAAGVLLSPLLCFRMIKPGATGKEKLRKTSELMQGFLKVRILFRMPYKGCVDCICNLKGMSTSWMLFLKYPLVPLWVTQLDGEMGDSSAGAVLNVRAVRASLEAELETQWSCCL